MLSPLIRCWCLGLLLSLAVPLQAQPLPVTFGSADDPNEQSYEVWWRPQSMVDVMGGFSLIAAQWRAATSVTADIVSQPISARLSGIARVGYFGDYRPDLDEFYDLLRLIEFVRLTPDPAPTSFYARIGLTRRMRLGTGHLVDFFRSDMAWDERTIGAEAYKEWGFGSIGVFTNNVLLNHVTGGEVRLYPLGWVSAPRVRSVSVGLNYVTDLALRDQPENLTAYNIDVQFDAFTSGPIRLRPFASLAWYADHGRGLALGAQFESLNFLDLARFQIGMTLYYNGEEFIPGYYGAFYTVSNPLARILDSDGSSSSEVEGTLLADARGGNAFAVEMRVLFFQRFEFWYLFRRHYGTQALSEYHLRLFAHGNNRFRLMAGIDRGGLRGFITLFNDLGDQTALLFEANYRIAGSWWLFLHARYTYEPRPDAEDGTERFLVQRRFEPLTGFRIRL